MLIQQILLKIFHTFQQERTISAAFHLLKGKRSGQTIQDVGLFKLYQYFGVLPKLSRQKFEEQVDLLFAKNEILIEENGFYQLTEQGLQRAQQPFSLEFDGWHYRGNEHTFFARLSLITQSLSYQANHVKAFIPMERNETVQHWVRSFLIRNHYQTNPMQQKLFDEIERSLHATRLEENVKDLLVYRLSGYEEAGITWQQIAFSTHMHEMDVQLLYISGLHKWLKEIEKNNGYDYLYQMVENIRVEDVLTSSANETARLYKKGHSLDAICQMRRLKRSTIEDHLVEIAMHNTNFSIEPFVSVEDEQLILTTVEDYETKKLRTLHELLPAISYFQLRLTLAKGANQL